jgi:uncharacterized protein YecE (DUF72 family)
LNKNDDVQLHASPTLEPRNEQWESRVRVGTSSWSDRSLTQESDWFPKRTMKAADRIAYYAERFSVVEMETTYRFPPTPAITQQWADRTPDGFRFDIQAWSLFTGQPTMRQSLWEDLQREVKDERRDNPRLYAAHLPQDAIDECWKRFRHALEPLRQTDKLGTVILRFPRWFKPSENKRAILRDIRERLADYPVAVEFASADWVESSSCEYTFDFLEEIDMAFVCADANDDDPRGLNGVGATTSSVGVVRLLGRRRFDDEDAWSPDWRGYRYTHDELAGLVPRIRHLAESCDDLHVLIGTCWRDDAVRNGELLLQQLQRVSLL